MSQRAWCFGCGREIPQGERSRARAAHAARARPAVLAALVAMLLGGGVALVATTAQAGSQAAPGTATR